jgi:TonB family protein
MSKLLESWADAHEHETLHGPGRKARAISVAFHAVVLAAVVFARGGVHAVPESAVKEPPPRLVFITSDERPAPRTKSPEVAPATPDVPPSPVAPAPPSQPELANEQRVVTQVFDAVRASAMTPADAPVIRMGGLGATEVASNGTTVGRIVQTGGFGAARTGRGSIPTAGLTSHPFPSVAAAEPGRGAATIDGDQSFQLLNRPTPAYTEEALRLGISGRVVLRVALTADGAVQVLGVVSPPLGHGLDESAITAVNKLRCRPATKAGRPVTVEAVLSVVFELA